MCKLTLNLLTIIFIVFSLNTCAIIKQKDDTHSIQVEYYSKGSGIDFKSKKLLEEFLNTYNDKNHTSITYTILKQGKEGETVFTIEVLALSTKEIKHFKIELTEQLKTTKNYRIKEN